MVSQFIVVKKDYYMSATLSALVIALTGEQIG